ncbi:odorant receptor Or2-like [Schistocerca gregaria]|uniref:odorant receptor Or2-like n=1 Tax=Schistocerca gregaria TaxID=7010 RepID=UPI00211EAA28|nr:odorant receptor Or2-like [Schistocerca gregaria]
MGCDLEETEPLTWQYTAHSVLKYDLRILHLLCLWPLPGSLLFRTLTAFFTALCLGHIAEAGVNLCTLSGDMEAYTLALSAVSVVIVGVLKVTFFLRHERKYCRLVRWLDALVAAEREAVHGRPLLEAIFPAVQKRAVRIARGLLLYNCFLLAIWLTVPLAAPPEARRLPLQQLPFTDENAYPLYELSYALQALSIIFIGLINVHMDSFFTVAMIYTAALLRSLALRLADLQAHDTLSRAKGNGRGQKTATADELYGELCFCIRTHQEITRFVQHLESVMNPIAMMQLALGVFDACMLIFPAAYSPERGALLKCLVSGPTVAMQILLYCLGAHSVREQGESVSLAAYNCGWPDASARFTRAVQLIINRAQQPLALTAGGVYPIQRATFLSLLNAGYSYYAVLQNFNGR